MLLNNDRLSHWCVGALLTWALGFLLWGILVFHFWLGVPVAKIAAFTGIGCALQLAITPWLFSARATLQNPTGKVTRRYAAVVVWISLTIVLFVYFIQRGQPKNPELREILFGTPIVAGAVALIVVGAISRSRRKSVTKSKL